MVHINKYIGISLLALVSLPIGMSAHGDFKSQLVASGYVHAPLPLEVERSLEHCASEKRLLADTEVAGFADLKRWTHEGVGQISKDPTGDGVVLNFVNPMGVRAVGPESDPDYALYGHCIASFNMEDINLDEYNRLAVDIFPECHGARVVNINMLMVNDYNAPDGKGQNDPTGYHLIHLDNNALNRCYLEVGDLKRNRVKEVRFSISLNGRDLTTGDSASYKLSNLRLQKVERPDFVAGWQPYDDEIVYSMTGYDLSGHKTAVVNGATAGRAKEFSLIDVVSGQEVFMAPVATVTTTVGDFGELDFSTFSTPGTYVIKMGDITTQPFAIGGAEIWNDSQWRVLNFIFGQRCGYHVPGVHGKCHTDLFAVHNGERISYSGGWHDAGDLSQQTLQTADVMFALFESEAKVADSDPVLAARLREEALWGLDFVLRSRFGDGYRASSVGLLIWQDGKTDTFDDINTVRVQDVSFDNFLYAGYEAYAAMQCTDDPMLREYLTKVAQEDFRFAMERYKKSGFGGFINAYEHSFNTSLSQFFATISWAASQLYRLTGESGYADEAASCIGYVLDCQQTEPISKDSPISGFFYRDKGRKSLVHYIHQSREQVYMQALAELCRTQPSHPDYERWSQAMRLYGDYLKTLMAYTAPYGMIPSGVYRDDEYLDHDGFYALHLFPPANAEELYKEQLKGGMHVAPHFYVKRFPIWFNIFNGNLAVHASVGKAAAICGNFLDDDALRNIGREQLYWIVGKNPFRQSLIYGEGHNYPALNNFSSGPTTGAMPVGIRSLGNTDEPYWPQINNACYKEVWVTSAGKWLSLISEL